MTAEPLAADVSDPEVEIRLLGDFDLRRGDEQVTIQRRAQRVLAILAVHRRSLSRDAVSATLWPDLDVAKRGARLRQALWTIRSESSLELVERTGGNLSISSRVAVDVDRLRATIDGHPSLDSVDEFVKAAGRGAVGLLPSWDETWLDPFRGEVNHLIESACRTVVDALRSSAPNRARQVAELWVEWTPHNESAYRALLEILDALGHTSAAIATHDRLAGVLRGALDLAVSGDLAARQRQRLDTQGRDQPMTRTNVVAPLAFGSERTLLLDRATLVEEGFPAITIVTGEAGSGKTALCQSIAADLEWRGWSTVKLTGGGEGLEPETLNSTGLRPLAVLVDDAHGVGAAMSVAVRDLVDRLGDRRLLLIAATRGLEEATREGRTLLHLLDTLPISIRIPMEPMNLRRVRDVAHHFDERLGVAEAKRILEHSGGNPQVVQLLLHSLSVTKDGVDLRTANIADRDPITDVIDSLETTPRRVVGAITLAQTPLSLGALKAAFASTETVEILDALTHLCRLGLVASDNGHYRIAHGRVHVAVAASLAPDEHAALVDTLLDAIGDRISALRTGSLAELRGDSRQAFDAFTRAGNAAEAEGDHGAAVAHYCAALPHLDAAGSDKRTPLLLALYDAASVVGDLEQCRGALGQLKQQSTDESSAAIELREGWLALKDDDVVQATETSTRLLDMKLDASLWPPDGGAFRLHALAAHELGNGLDARDRLQGLLPIETEPGSLAEIHLSLALIARLHSEKGLGLTNLERAADLYQVAGNEQGWFEATRMMGVVQIHAGRRDIGLQLLSDASLRAKRLQDHTRWIRCQASIAMSHITLLDEPGFALAILRPLVPRARQFQSSALVAELMNLIAMIEGVDLGRSDLASEIVQEGIRLAENGGHKWVLGLLLHTASEIAQVDGDPDSAISLLRDSLEVLEHCGEIPPCEVVHADLAALEATNGNRDAATLHLRKAYALQELHDHTEHLAAILRRHGHVLSADQLHAEAAEKHIASVAELCPGVALRHLYFDDAANSLLAAGRELEGCCYKLRAWSELERSGATFEPDERTEVLALNAHLVSDARRLQEHWELVELPLLEDGRRSAPVCWERMPDTVADDQARRRNAVRRLCEQATQQGTSATRFELARAIGVSERTMTRDLAVIATSRSSASDPAASDPAAWV